MEGEGARFEEIRERVLRGKTKGKQQNMPLKTPQSFQQFSTTLNKTHHLKKNFFFILYWTINNVVIISGGQQMEAPAHIHRSILPQTPLPSKLPHNIEHSSRWSKSTTKLITFFFLVLFFVCYHKPQQLGKSKRCFEKPGALNSPAAPSNGGVNTEVTPPV